MFVKPHLTGAITVAALTAVAAASIVAGSARASVAVPAAPGGVQPLQVTPPALHARATSHRRPADSRSLASDLPSVYCGSDAMSIRPLRDGRATGGEWMYWWPKVLTGTYFTAPNFVLDEGPLFANRAGTNSFFYPLDSGAHWNGPYTDIATNVTSFPYWSQVFQVDDWSATSPRPRPCDAVAGPRVPHERVHGTEPVDGRLQRVPVLHLLRLVAGERLARCSPALPTDSAPWPCVGPLLHWLGAPVAQWIEQRFPKPRAQVRFLSGALTNSPAEAPLAVARPWFEPRGGPGLRRRRGDAAASPPDSAPLRFRKPGARRGLSGKPLDVRRRDGIQTSRDPIEGCYQGGMSCMRYLYEHQSRLDPQEFALAVSTSMEVRRGPEQESDGVARSVPDRPQCPGALRHRHRRGVARRPEDLAGRREPTLRAQHELDG